MTLVERRAEEEGERKMKKTTRKCKSTLIWKVSKEAAKAFWREKKARAKRNQHENV